MGETIIPDFLRREVETCFLDLAEPPRAVLDIGAYIGAWSLAASRRWPDAQIHAYEPVHENRMNFAALHHDSERVRLHPYAVRAEGGRRQMYMGETPLTHSFHQRGRQTQRNMMVDCLGADTLPPAEFLKLDTEGCELEILQAMNLSSARAVIVEYHSAADRELIGQLLFAQDFYLVIHNEQVGPDNGILRFARRGAVAAKKVDADHCFLAIPVYGGLDPHFTKCLLRTIVEPPCRLSLSFNIGDSLVNRSRNHVVADFLESNCSHLLFLDSDLIFSPEHIHRLMNHPEPIVGGFYPKKQEGPVHWVCNAHDQEQPIGPTGLQRMRYMGTGCLRIAREVFERMISSPVVEHYLPDHRKDRSEFDFFPVGVYRYPDGNRRFLSEDWFFCQRALDLGYDVWGDTRVALKHVGQAVFPLVSQQETILAEPAIDAPTVAGVHRPAPASSVCVPTT